MIYNKDYLKVDIIYNKSSVNMSEIEDNSVDLIPTDCPYGISFMGKQWDKALPPIEIWRECLRVLKPGAFAFVMSGPRQDCLARMIVRLEDAGFRVGFTSLYWTFASGFPKASNIGKAVDKRGGKYLEPRLFSQYIKQQREKKGLSLKQLNRMFGYVAGCNWWEADGDNFRIPNNNDYKKLKDILDLDNKYDHLVGAIGKVVDKQVRGNCGFSKEQVSRPWKEHIGEEYNITAPATPQAKALDGAYSGFQPKPSVEVILVAMKPLSEKTYVDQALANGKGVTWLDDGRIPTKENLAIDRDGTKKLDTQNQGWGFKAVSRGNQGRFPANILVSDDILNDGTIHKSGLMKQYIEGGQFNVYGKQYPRDVETIGDSGGFSRFFSLDAWWEERIKNLPTSVQKTFPYLITAKAAKREKNRGCEELYWGRDKSVSGYHQIDKEKYEWLGQEEERIYKETKKRMSLRAWGNIHTTVKPMSLFSYLIVLGSRENDIVLDPFLGSGTTACTAKALNRRYIGFDNEIIYNKISDCRIEAIERGELNESK